MSQPTHNEGEPVREWGIMILADLVGSTPQGLMGSDEELREYHRRRIEHVTEVARGHGIERLDDQGNADLLFLPGDETQPLLELFHDLNARNRVPNYLHFRPALRMVGHHQRFTFSPRNPEGMRKQLSSNHLTMLFRLEKACPERALLMSRQLYELIRDHIPADWPQCSKPIPPKLKEWLKLTGEEIYWLALPGTDLQSMVDSSYLRLCEEAKIPQTVPRAERNKQSHPKPSEQEIRSRLINRLLDVAVLAVTIFAFWQGMADDNWLPLLLLPVTGGLKLMWVIWDWSAEVTVLAFTSLKVLAFTALFAAISGLRY